MNDPKLQDKILDFRASYNALPPIYQERERQRLNRIAEGRPAIIAEPLDDHTRRFTFNTPTELIEFLTAQQIEVKSNSNIYKCLRGIRKTAYGYKIFYEK